MKKYHKYILHSFLAALLCLVSANTFAESIKLKITYKGHAITGYTVEVVSGSSFFGKGVTDTWGEVDINGGNLPSRAIHVSGKQETPNRVRWWAASGGIRLDGSNFVHLRLENFLNSGASLGFKDEEENSSSKFKHQTTNLQLDWSGKDWKAVEEARLARAKRKRIEMENRQRNLTLQRTSLLQRLYNSQVAIANFEREQKEWQKIENANIILVRMADVGLAISKVQENDTQMRLALVEDALGIRRLTRSKKRSYRSQLKRVDKQLDALDKKLERLKNIKKPEDFTRFGLKRKITELKIDLKAEQARRAITLGKERRKELNKSIELIKYLRSRYKTYLEKERAKEAKEKEAKENENTEKNKPVKKKD